MSGTFPTVINGVKIDMPVIGVVNADGSALSGGGGSIASETTLAEIRDAILQQRGFAVAIVKDSVDAYFMQVWTLDQATQLPSVSIYNLDGTLATTQVPPFSVASKTVTVNTVMYVATATKPQYTAGDKLSFTTVYSDGSRFGVIWHNETLNTAISPPVAGDYEAEGETVNLPANASTLTEQQAQTIAQQRIRDAVEKTAAVVSGKTAVTGIFNAVGNSATFEPIAGRDFNLQIIFGAGVTGNIQLEQSLNGGANFYPLTGSGVAIMRFTSSAVEQWANNEVGTLFRLACTSVSGGNIDYRISQ